MSHNESAVEHTLYLDRDNQEVWRGKQRLKLTPKAFAVLAYLVTHAERIVDKKELLHELWPAADVSEWVLTTCIREIRRELEDAARTSRYIKTVYRRGYQFIGPLSTRSRPPSEARRQRSEGGALQCVGRDRQHAQLQQAFEAALTGTRQLVFVTGESGIGKTTLVETFMDDISATVRVWLGRGQCINLYGRGEAYLPVLEALEHACQGGEGTALGDGLWRYAPTWGYQIPTLRQTAQKQKQHRQLHETTQSRMLREIAEALEKITQHRSLVLWLEDLHWSDSATLDFISYIARREEPAQLLIIGTYRPEDIADLQHPLRTVKQELQLHKRCTEIPLPLLTETAVEDYLCARFGTPTLPPQCGHFVHQRSEGNPLFMLNVVDDLLAREVLMPRPSGLIFANQAAQRQGGVPDDLQHLVELQFERLSQPDQRLLEVASVVGASFSVATLVAGAEQHAEQIEARCESLGQRNQFIVDMGREEWPDGTASAQYGFRHALYQEVLYERLPLGRRSLVHQRIGAYLERTAGGQLGERAAELAMHFERGGDVPRAVQYHCLAGENALARKADREACQHLTASLRLLRTLPESKEQLQQELGILIGLSPPLIATQGYGSSEVEHVVQRAYALCQQVGEPLQRFIALGGVYGFWLIRAELATAQQLAEDMFETSRELEFDLIRASAHLCLGNVLLLRGDFVPAREHLQRSFDLYDPDQARMVNSLADPGVTCLVTQISVLWHLGYAEQAWAQAEAADALARDLRQPYSIAYVLAMTIRLHWWQRAWEQIPAVNTELARLSEEYGFALWSAITQVWNGRIRVIQGEAQEGIRDMQAGIAACESLGNISTWPATIALLASAYGHIGQAERGLSLLEDATEAMQKTGELWEEAEIQRLKGELLLKQVAGAEERAERHFRQAMRIAHRQQAKGYELRATVDLSRLLQAKGKTPEARRKLEKIHAWFTEGFDTADYQEATTLLAELS